MRKGNEIHIQRHGNVTELVSIELPHSVHTSQILPEKKQPTNISDFVRLIHSLISGRMMLAQPIISIATPKSYCREIEANAA